MASTPCAHKRANELLALARTKQYLSSEHNNRKPFPGYSDHGPFPWIAETSMGGRVSTPQCIPGWLTPQHFQGYGVSSSRNATHLEVFHSIPATSHLLPSSPCQPLSSTAVRLPSQALRPLLWRVNEVFPQRDRLCFPIPITTAISHPTRVRHEVSRQRIWRRRCRIYRSERKRDAKNWEHGTRGLDVP